MVAAERKKQRGAVFPFAPLLKYRRRRKEVMSKKNNRINVPEARDAMDKFKMEAASDLGVSIPY